jgi:hypothetical protein
MALDEYPNNSLKALNELGAGARTKKESRLASHKKGLMRGENI